MTSHIESYLDHHHTVFMMSLIDIATTKEKVSETIYDDCCNNNNRHNHNYRLL